MDKSRYRRKSKIEVIQEYSLAARKADEYQRSKWGSRESMINRFLLGYELIDWRLVKRWMDVGCGGGTFFMMAENQGRIFDLLVGVDICSEALSFAHSKSYVSPCEFVHQDFIQIDRYSQQFDLVTLIGVLQQCGSLPRNMIESSASHLCEGGQLFLTTKNIGWQSFHSGELEPDSSHSWFDYDELVEIVRAAGFMLISSGGFLPREGRQVPLSHSHTMYMYAKRK